MNEVIVILEQDETLVKKKKTKKTPNYYRVGNGTMNKHKIQSVDILRELAMMTKAEQFVFLVIKDGITFENGYEPVVRIDRKELTTTQVQYLDKGYKLLEAKDLVRRIKRGHYMINPNALVPNDYEKWLAVWDKAKK